MKKLFTIALMFFMLFSLASCKKDETNNDEPKDPVVRTYVADGEYTAYSISEDATKPEVIFVTITIKDDKLTDVEIDTIQGTFADGVAKFNEKSKKELGYAYHMHYYTYLGELAGATPSEEGYVAWLKANNKLEWFEQMELIEKQILANGADSVTVADGSFTNVSGVTVHDYGYVTLAKEAIQNAKDGKKVGIAVVEDDLIVATANVDKEGKLSNVSIDAETGSINKTDNTWSWSAQSKRELGYAYHMHYYTYLGELAGATPSEEGYVAWLKTNNKLEWFEQADLIAAAWASNHNVEYSTIAGATIKDASYLAALNKLAK